MYATKILSSQDGIEAEGDSHDEETGGIDPSTRLRVARGCGEIQDILSRDRGMRFRRCLRWRWIVLRLQLMVWASEDDVG